MLSFYWLFIKQIFSATKKVMVVILVFSIIIGFFLYFINKDKPKFTYDLREKNREEIYKIINDKNLNSTKEGKLTIALYRGVICGMIGEGCTDNPKDDDKNFHHSFFGFLSNLIILPYVNPPASGIYWAYSGLQNAGFIPKTYAAEGIGFASLKPIMSLWKVFRDISYMLLVLILIAVGFMIMFRMKLNPQTVISVENALPKIVISLILITFSFAIAGFLIDLMYIVILLAISIFTTLNIGELQTANQGNIFTEYSSGNFFTLWSVFLKEHGIANFYFVGQSLLRLLGEGISNALAMTVGLILSTIVVRHTTQIFEDFINKPTKNIGAGAATFSVHVGEFFSSTINALLFIILMTIFSPIILPAFIGLLVFLTVVFLIFRIFILLLKTYLEIILLIVISPIILLFEAIPGRNAFSTWFKNLFAYILTFPLVIIIFLIGYALMQQSASNNQLWTPPFLISINASVFPILIGMGLLLIIPDLIKAFREFIGAKGLGVSIGIGTFFGGVGAAWAGAQTGLGQITSFAQFPLINKFIPDKLKQYIVPPTFSEALRSELEPRLLKKN